MPAKRKTARRGRGEGSISWRQDLQMWQGSVSLGRKPDGRRDRPCCYGRTKTEVVAKLQELRRTPRPAPSAEPVLFGAYAQQWLQGHGPSLAPLSERRYRYHVRHLIRYLDQEPISSLTSLRVERLYRQMATDGYSASEIGFGATVLGSICRAAKRAGLLQENPVPGVPRPKVIRGEIHPLAPDQVAAFLAAARQSQHFSLYVLAIDTGMRAGELLALEWGDIDWERSSVRVERMLKVIDSRLVVAQLKTKRSRRTIRISQQTLAVLAEHRERALRVGHIKAPVFCSRNGTHLWPVVPCFRHYRQLLRRAGLPFIRFHDLRHTCATLLLLLEEKTLVVSERLGHSKPSITMDVYQHLLEGMQAGAADKMDRLLGSILDPESERSVARKGSSAE